jgi:hypothetical protein
MLGGGGTVVSPDGSHRKLFQLVESYPSGAATWTVTGTSSAAIPNSTVNKIERVTAYVICTT